MQRPHSVTHGLIDLGRGTVNAARVMDEDDFFTSRPSDPLTLLGRQDLDPISIAELDERIALLRAEIARVEAHIARVTSHRSAADELFKR